jgi:glycosyltransferase involved in cell wall biosynthesis
MNNVLSIVNAKSWSWGIITALLLPRLAEKYHFANILRIPKVRLDMEQAGVEVIVKLPAQMVDPGLTEFFDAILLQNVDLIKLVEADKRKKAVVRMGGMVVNEKNPATRYDDELASVGAVIATNETLAKVAARVNPHTTLIPNGVDLERFRPAQERPARKFTVGFAGMIWGPGLEYKGYKLFVQAAILLAGDVEIKTVLHSHSQVPHADMPEKFYHQIDCLVLPSEGEGCSNVTAEALACGVPVLITKVGYHGEMLIARDECMFVTRDVENIRDTILVLMQNPDLQLKLARNGRAFAEQHHDINVIAKQYDEVFQALLRRNGNG